MKRHFWAAALALVACRAGLASAETVTYAFLPERSTVLQEGGFAGVHEIYSVEGQFQMSVDADAATVSFDSVDATLDRPLFFFGEQSLGELFVMTELQGTVVSDTQFDFTGRTTGSMPADILLQLTFEDDLVRLTGGFDENLGGGADGFIVTLDAAAAVVPEPASLLLLGSGLALLIAYRRRTITRRLA